MLGDIRAQVAAGAQHITFGDPDFFNGPTHARRIVEALHARVAGAHLRRHHQGRASPAARGPAAACSATPAALFVTSAVESLDDAVLGEAGQGAHARGLRTRGGPAARVGLTLVPTFVAFHALDDDRPRTWRCSTRSRSSSSWSTCAGAAGDPSSRPERFAAAGADDIASGSRRLRSPALAYAGHPDPRVDALQREVDGARGSRLTGGRAGTLRAVHALARERAGVAAPAAQSARASPGRRCRIWTSPGTVERSPGEQLALL